jgi:hypothetical protein
MFGSKIEKDLENMYAKLLTVFPTGMSRGEARKAVKEAIKDCRKRAREEGTDKLPSDYGDLLLAGEKGGHPGAKGIVEKARREGATDDDVREWWNLPDVARRLVLWSEEVFRLSVFYTALDEGVSDDRAAERVRKMYPMYGDPDDTAHTSGDDRPLPPELRGRVDRYRERVGAQVLKDRSMVFSTFNAFVRAEIRKGKL